MTTVPGPKNRPTVSAASAPEFAADLDTVSAYAAYVGNRKIADLATMTAWPAAEIWPGLEVVDPDTGIVYVRIGTTWVKDRRIMPVKSWTYQRPGTSDTFGAGSFAALGAFSIANAPTGVYEVHAQASLSGSVASSGNIRFLVDAASINSDEFAGVQTEPSIATSHGLFTWTGSGTLIFTLLCQLSAGLGTVYAHGTAIYVTYVGP